MEKEKATVDNNKKRHQNMFDLVLRNSEYKGKDEPLRQSVEKKYAV